MNAQHRKSARPRRPDGSGRSTRRRETRTRWHDRLGRLAAIAALLMLAVPAPASAQTGPRPPGGPPSGPAGDSGADEDDAEAKPLLVDWQLGAAPPPTDFAPAPFLHDDNANALADFFESLPAHMPRVVTIVEPLAPAGPAETLFDDHQIDWVFADYETPDGEMLTQQLVDQVRSSQSSADAVVGNFAYVAGDAGTNMSNPALYPGSRTLFTGLGEAPNIRSRLFTAPVERFTDYLAAADSDATHIPYVTRFNNWSNDLLNTTDVLDGELYQFDTRRGSADAGQLLSRADYQVLVQTYRLLGADGLHVFNASVYDERDTGLVRYSQHQLREDTRAGWRLLDDHVELTDTTGIENTLKPAQGLTYTAIADAEALHLLISNLADEPLADIDFDTILDRPVGSIVEDEWDTQFELERGHHLWTFEQAELAGEEVWDFASGLSLFEDPALLNTHGIGVPEPTSGALLAAGAALLLLRGRRDRRFATPPA